jgi:hypothetical protein
MRNRHLASAGSSLTIVKCEMVRRRSEVCAMNVGVFVPIGNNSWLASATSPQYKPSFDLNRAIDEKAERHGASSV